LTIIVQGDLGQLSSETLRRFTQKENYIAQDECDAKASLVKLAVNLGFIGTGAYGKASVVVWQAQGLVVSYALGVGFQNEKAFSDYFQIDLNASNTDFVTARPIPNNKVCAALGNPGAPGRGGEPLHEQYVIDMAKLNQVIVNSLQAVRSALEKGESNTFNERVSNGTAILRSLSAKLFEQQVDKNITKAER
jgi:hypothetical protein